MPRVGKSFSPRSQKREAKPEASKSNHAEAENNSRITADTDFHPTTSRRKHRRPTQKSDETGSVEKRLTRPRLLRPRCRRRQDRHSKRQREGSGEGGRQARPKSKVEAKSAEKSDEVKTDAAKAEAKAEPVTVK